MQSRSLLWRSFYFFMSLLIAAVVVFGFSFTVEAKLFHPAIPPPFIVYLRGVFFGVVIILYPANGADPHAQGSMAPAHGIFRRGDGRLDWMGVFAVVLSIRCLLPTVFCLLLIAYCFLAFLGESVGVPATGLGVT